jgi:hypothetical protein
MARSHFRSEARLSIREGGGRRRQERSAGAHVQELRTRVDRPGGPFLIYHFIRQEQGDLLHILPSLNAQLARALGEFGPLITAPTLEEQFKALWSPSR